MNHSNELSSLVKDCREATLNGIKLVVSRFEKNKNYPFVDTKLSTLSGKDFDEPSDLEVDFRGRTAVFGWIQGRGLESLAGHAAFLSSDPKLASRCDRMLETAGNRIYEFGRASKGRFVFLFTPEGKSFRMDTEGRRQYFSAVSAPPGPSDLFTSKGLVAAGARLKHPEWVEMGLTTFRGFVKSLENGTYKTDQILFDPKNPAKSDTRIFGQGVWMLSVGGYALLTELFPDEDEWIKDGCKAVKIILDRHVIKGKHTLLNKYDFLENVDSNHKPWVDNGKILQDPGHALEFTGLAAKFILSALQSNKASEELQDLAETCRELLPEIFLSAFANGFNKKEGGICKAFDLVERKPLNDDMPWWSLPESMRAAALLLKLSPDHAKALELVSAAKDCSTALFGPFRSPVPGLFYQTRDFKGRPVAVVPATPDADPGYHTGLCLIDFINTVNG